MKNIFLSTFIWTWIMKLRLLAKETLEDLKEKESKKGKEKKTQENNIKTPSPPSSLTHASSP